MMSDQPLVSIITPVHNGAKYIEELILSVKEQDYPNIEHIIIDDGSNDDGATVAILKKYPHLRWWSQENLGQYATMNEGLNTARGDLICYVSADDLVAPGAVQSVMQHMIKYPELDGIYGKVFYIDETGNPCRVRFPFRKAPLWFYPFFTHLDHCSLYIQREALIKNRLFFDPLLRFVGDYDWILHILENHLALNRIDTILSKIRIHGEQASNVSQQDMHVEKILVANRHNVNKFLYVIMTTIYILSSGINKLELAVQEEGVKGFFHFLSSRSNLRFFRRLFGWLRL
jgi:glycosyltransferase involved in cell wall biosynthesis